MALLHREQVAWLSDLWSAARGEELVVGSLQPIIVSHKLHPLAHRAEQSRGKSFSRLSHRFQCVLDAELRHNLNFRLSPPPFFVSFHLGLQKKKNNSCLCCVCLCINQRLGWGAYRRKNRKSHFWMIVGGSMSADLLAAHHHHVINHHHQMTAAAHHHHHHHHHSLGGIMAAGMVFILLFLIHSHLFIDFQFKKMPGMTTSPSAMLTSIQSSSQSPNGGSSSTAVAPGTSASTSSTVGNGGGGLNHLVSLRNKWRVSVKSSSKVAILNDWPVSSGLYPPATNCTRTKVSSKQKLWSPSTGPISKNFTNYSNRTPSHPTITRNFRYSIQTTSSSSSYLTEFKSFNIWNTGAVAKGALYRSRETAWTSIGSRWQVPRPSQVPTSAHNLGRRRDVLLFQREEPFGIARLVRTQSLPFTSRETWIGRSNRIDHNASVQLV